MPIDKFVQTIIKKVASLAISMYLGPSIKKLDGWDYGTMLEPFWA